MHLSVLDAPMAHALASSSTGVRECMIFFVSAPLVLLISSNQPGTHRASPSTHPFFSFCLVIQLFRCASQGIDFVDVNIVSLQYKTPERTYTECGIRS